MGEIYRIRRYEHNDYNEYVELYEAVYSKKIDSQYFQWKHYLNNKINNAPLIYLVFNENGQMIGANSFFSSKFMCNDEECLAVQSGDTMVIKEYRGKGLFKKIIQYAMNDLKNSGYKFIYGFANDNSYPGFERLGFSKLYKVNILYKIFNFKNVFSSKLTKVPGGKYIGSIANCISNLQYIKRCEDYCISESKVMDDEVNAYMNKFLKGKIHQVKDTEVLSWKYEMKPEGNYKTMVVKKNGGIAGLFVVRVDIEKDSKYGSIMEYFLTEGEDITKVFKALVNYCRSENLDYLQIWDIGEEKIKSACTSLHFIKRAVGLHFIVKILDENFINIENLSKWHIVNGDADTA